MLRGKMRLVVRSSGVIFVTTALLKAAFISEPATWLANALSLSPGAGLMAAWMLVGVELIAGVLIAALPERSALLSLGLCTLFLAVHAASVARPDLGVCPCLGVPFAAEYWPIARIVLPVFLLVALAANIGLFLSQARHGPSDPSSLSPVEFTT